MGHDRYISIYFRSWSIGKIVLGSVACIDWYSMDFYEHDTLRAVLRRFLMGDGTGLHGLYAKKECLKKAYRAFKILVCVMSRQHLNLMLKMLNLLGFQRL